MNKNIGFIRKVTLPWLDAVAAFRTETANPADIRERLDPVLRLDLKGAEGRRKTTDVLLGVWVRSQQVAPTLHKDALTHFQTSTAPADRLWLHYGLSLVYYPFFRECTAIIGQLTRNATLVTTAAVTERMAAKRGQLGSLYRAVGWLVSSLRDWGALRESERRYAYRAKLQTLEASTVDLEIWLLACALHAHPAEEMPFADLVRLPELFPFRFVIRAEDLRQSSYFTVERHTEGWHIVRLELLTEAQAYQG